MAYIAVMGHGVVGSGVMEVLTEHAESISRRAKEEIHVKYIITENRNIRRIQLIFG